MAEAKEVRVILNGMFYESCPSLKAALSSVLSVKFKTLEYVSVETMRHWISEAFSLIEECSDAKKDSRVKRQLTNARKYLERDLDRSQLMSFYIDLVMGGEGLSTLSGFGMATISKTGGKRRTTSTLKLNPERMSIYDIEKG